MFTKRRAFLCCGLFMLTLSGCSDESSISDSGGGAQPGDGGANSAQYAGTYNGALTVKYSGGELSGESDSVDVVLVIAKDGTVKLSGDDVEVSGTINGNKVNVSIKIVEKQDGLECEGRAVINATVSGNKINGPVNGDAECEILGVNVDSATITGSLTATKQ